MKKTGFVIVLVSLFTVVLYPQVTRSQETWKLGVKYGGKLYESSSDPDYLSFEREAKAILLDEIKNQHGVELNGDLFSSDQLLEIKALLKFKHARESVDYILSRFPGAVL